MFYTTVKPSATKEGNVYSDIWGRFLASLSIGNKYIYVMYVYDFNAIQIIAINDGSDMENIKKFTELTEFFLTAESAEDYTSWK